VRKGLKGRMAACGGPASAGGHAVAPHSGGTEPPQSPVSGAAGNAPKHQSSRTSIVHCSLLIYLLSVICLCLLLFLGAFF
jgi:hypothetical protein